MYVYICIHIHSYLPFWSFELSIPCFPFCRFSHDIIVSYPCKFAMPCFPFWPCELSTPCFPFCSFIIIGICIIIIVIITNIIVIIITITAPIRKLGSPFRGRR